MFAPFAPYSTVLRVYELCTELCTVLPILTSTMCAPSHTCQLHTDDELLVELSKPLQLTTKLA